MESNETQQAVLIRPDGTIEAISPKGEAFTLEELYELIGTDIVEFLPHPNPKLELTFVVDEEGLLKESLANTLAWYLSGRALVGNVLLTPNKFIR